MTLLKGLYVFHYRKKNMEKKQQESKVMSQGSNFLINLEIYLCFFALIRSVYITLLRARRS